MKYQYEIQQVGVDENGIERMKGRVIIKGVTFRFSLYPTETQGYRQRAHMSILSPQDGKVLQLSGEKRQTIIARLSEAKRRDVEQHKRIRELMAVDDFFLVTGDPKEREDKIVKKALEMSITYAGEIQSAQGKPQDTNISADRAFQAEGKRFIAKNSSAGTNSKAKDNLATLEKLCDQLSEKAMCDVTVDDIHRFANKLSGQKETRKRKLSLLSRFWEHCIGEGVIDGRNPVKQYMQENTGLKKRRSSRVSKAEEHPGRLEKDQEEKLLQYARGQLDNGLSLSIPLLNGGGITPTIQAGLKWSDVVIDQDDHSDVRVHINMANNSWATQDYTRALFRAEGAIVYEGYERLCKMLGGTDAVNELPVISAKGDTMKCVPPGEITAYIRDALLRAGVKNSTLAPSKNRDPRVGMGTQLLQKNYKAKLLECGLETDNGLVDFLCLKKIASVTANHYRSFTSQEAQQYIRSVLDRYRGNDQNVDRKPITKAAKRKEGRRRIWMEKSDSPRCNRLEVSIVLGKGQECRLDSGKGITGELFILSAETQEEK